MPSIEHESKTLMDQWEEDKLIRNGASVAMFSILAFAPMLALITLLLQLIGVDGTQVTNTLASIIGENSAQRINNILGSNIQNGWSVGLISIVSLLAAVYAVARQLRETLNEVFEVDRDEPLKDEMQRNARALAMVLLVGLVIIGVFALIAAVGALGQLVPDLATSTQVFAQVVNFVGVAALMTLVFGFVYKAVPDVELRWRDLLTGTAAAGVLFAVGASVVTWYINNSAGVQSSTNLLGSTIVVLIWTLYTSVILLFGAELVQHNARRNGRTIQPDY